MSTLNQLNSSVNAHLCSTIRTTTEEAHNTSSTYQSIRTDGIQVSTATHMTDPTWGRQGLSRRITSSQDRTRALQWIPTGFRTF
jgi:hypothetical protein